MSDLNITIHKAVNEVDIDAAAKIAIEAWKLIYNGYRLELGDELFEGFFSQWQESKSRSVKIGLRSGRGFTAKDDSKVVGFIYYLFDPETKIGTIGENVVCPAYRGQGIGGMLYQHVFECLKEEGAKYVKVTTGGDDGHAPARRAYEKAGFQEYLPSVVYYKKL
jgi:ribosomal protein S18 acetylase RimI-like enzyme